MAANSTRIQRAFQGIDEFCQGIASVFMRLSPILVRLSHVFAAIQLANAALVSFVTPITESDLRVAVPKNAPPSFRARS
jgi:hypothetical protein